MSQAEKCAQCGAGLLQDGSCPRCLLEIGLDSIDSAWATDPGAVELDPGCIPGFELIEKLGRGGMGVVYRARQTELDRMVAVKVLSPNVRHLPDFAERFRREARAMAALSHPNVVSIHDFGEASGLYYLVMELVEGANLRELMQSGKVSEGQALEIVRQVCSALHFAHERGVVHRDIKPENVLVDVDGRVRLTDFGLAKLLGGVDSGRLTQSRHVMGTPLYMAPEQVSTPLHVDHRADIYSLGVVLYELLTGDLPVGRFEMPSEQGAVDRRLDDVVLRALERRPEKRFQRVSEVSSELAAIESGVAEAPGSAAPAVAAARARGAEAPAPAAASDLPAWMVWYEVPVAAVLFLASCMRWIEPIHWTWVSGTQQWGVVSAVAALAVPAAWLACGRAPRREVMGFAALAAGGVAFWACVFVTRGFSIPHAGQLHAGFWLTLFSSLALLVIATVRLRVARRVMGWFARLVKVPVEVLMQIRATLPWIAVLGVPAIMLRFARRGHYEGIMHWGDTSLFEPWSSQAILIGSASAALVVMLLVTRHARVLAWDGVVAMVVGATNFIVAMDGAFQRSHVDPQAAAWLGLFTGVLLFLGGAVLLAARLAERARAALPAPESR